MTRLAVIAPPDFRALALLRDAGISFSEDATSADALLVSPRLLSKLRDVLADAKHVRWIHTLGAGVDTLPFDLLRNRDIVVTNSRGLYGDGLAEFVIASMLFFAKRLRKLMRNQDAHRWEPFEVEWLAGKTIGVIGFGGIGQAIGRRADAMGMRVLPVSRHAGDVDEVIAQSDYIALATPLTPHTRNLISAQRIARMKSNAVLINVSRGAIVDERALVDALRDKKIRGAALDVFETEPLPPDHPLWSLDNVLISPHSADHTTDSHDRAMRFFIENWRRFERGAPLENVVDLDAQY